MNTEEKLKLLRDVGAAIQALDRILDGGHQPNAVPERARNECLDAMSGLTTLKLRLVVEIGTDNL
jgi:hypothetical protein